MLKIKDSNRMLMHLRSLQASVGKAIYWGSTIGRYKDEMEKKAIQVNKYLNIIRADLALADLQMELIDNEDDVISAGMAMKWREIDCEEFYELIKTSDEMPLVMGKKCYWKKDEVFIAMCDSDSYHKTTLKYPKRIANKNIGLKEL